MSSETETPNRCIVSRHMPFLKSDCSKGTINVFKKKKITFQIHRNSIV